MSKDIRKLIVKHIYKNVGNKNENQHNALKQNSEKYEACKEKDSFFKKFQVIAHKMVHHSHVNSY